MHGTESRQQSDEVFEIEPISAVSTRPFDNF
jgi:hypothetical protein